MKLNLMLCAACAMTACATPPRTPGGEPTMSRDSTDTPPPRPPVAAKRRAPPAVSAVMLDGIRYEQAVLAAGDAQRTGYLAAYKGSSDERLWRVRVYELRTDLMLESDVQDVYFTTMTASADGHEVVIENEAGGRFAVDVRTHGVRRLD